MTTPPNDRTDRSTDASRREFLTLTAGVAGAAMVGRAGMGKSRPSIKTNNDTIPKAKPRADLADGDPIKIGVIGPGGMGTAHCHAIMGLAAAGHENVQIVAVCDVCDPRAENARKACSEKQGIEVDSYRYHEDLLARDDLHGVLIASPEHWHAKHAEDAIAAGKDVYVEKPMTLRLDEALRLREVMLANPDMRLQVGTQMIMQPKYGAARDLIREGSIGKPVFSQTGYCRNSKNGEWLYYGIDPAWKPGETLDWERWCGDLGPHPWNAEEYARWRRYKKWSTGIIGDLLVHRMTPFVYALEPGWPTRVTGAGGHYVDKAMENHDQVNLTIEFESEHTMVVAGSTCNDQSHRDMIRGHEATLYLGGRHCELKPQVHWVDDHEARTVECPDIGNDQDQLRLNWLKCIRSRDEVQSPVDLGTKIMVIVDLATRSMWDGGAWGFDPSTMTAKRL